MNRETKLSGSRRRTLNAAIIITAGLAAANVSAQERMARWEAVVSDSGAVAADCQNCDEAIAISMACEKGAGQFLVELRGVPTDQGRTGDIVGVSLIVDGVAESREGRLAYVAPLGYVPVVEMDARDALTQRIAAGQVLTVHSTGSVSTVPLAGSFRAIDILRRTCG